MEEQRIMRPSIFYKPPHRLDHVPSGWHPSRIPRIIPQYENVFFTIPPLSCHSIQSMNGERKYERLTCQEAFHVRNVINTTLQLALLPKIIDTDLRTELRAQTPTFRMK